MQTYRQDWALFTDWCAATGNQALPAAPDTVLEFLTACPAARSTQRCRVAAIDHHHATAGMVKPGESGDVRAVLGRPTAASTELVNPVPAVEAALRVLPSHGWTRGMFGRRDRCLLVLSQVAGVPYQELAELTVGMVSVAGGAARISAAGAIILRAKRRSTKPTGSPICHRISAGQPGTCMRPPRRRRCSRRSTNGVPSRSRWNP